MRRVDRRPAMSAGLGDQVMSDWPPPLPAFRPCFMFHNNVRNQEGNCNVLTTAEKLFTAHFSAVTLQEQATVALNTSVSALEKSNQSALTTS